MNRYTPCQISSVQCVDGVAQFELPKDADILHAEVAYVNLTTNEPALRIYALVNPDPSVRRDPRRIYAVHVSEDMPQGVGASEFLCTAHYMEGKYERTVCLFVGQYDRGVMTKEMPKAHADITPGYKAAKYNTLEND